MLLQQQRVKMKLMHGVYCRQSYILFDCCGTRIVLIQYEMNTDEEYEMNTDWDEAEEGRLYL